MSARVMMVSAALVAALCRLPAGADEKPPVSEEQISRLIRQLGAEDFAAREKAHRALLQAGQPAVEQLRKVIARTTDAEVKRRALKIVRAIDPGGERRAELEKRRAEVMKVVEEAQGVDVKSWAESVCNPFSELSAEGKKRLAAEGIDVPRLQKMRARYLAGSYCGACQKEFVNRDPDTIVIVGKDFCTHGGLTSAGPVLATENAYFMSQVSAAGVVWFVDKAGASSAVAGVPVLAAEGAGMHALAAGPDIRVGDFGWRRPKRFLRPLTPAEAGNDPPATKELAKARRQLAEQIKAMKAEDVRQVAREIANPFTALTEEGKVKLRLRGIEVERLPKLKAVYLTGNFCGAALKDLVNKDPDTVLVIGKGFITHGQVYSLGPILAVGDAHFMGNVTGADLVWLADESFPRGQTQGAPVILGPTAGHSQMHILDKHVWHGDYGWRAPRDFPGRAKVGAEKGGER